MLLSLNKNTPVNKEEFNSRVLETHADMTDVAGYDISDFEFETSGWVLIEAGSRGEIEDVEFIQEGTDDVTVDLDGLMKGAYISENPDTDIYSGQDGWAEDEFVGVDIYDEYISVQRSEETGYVICHITIEKDV